MDAAAAAAAAAVGAVAEAFHWIMLAVLQCGIGQITF